MSKAVKLYPIRGRFLMDAPATVHVVDSQKEADALIETGAFTDDPNHAERDTDAPDDTKPAKTEGPAETGGSSDSTSKE
jgi:hypothetical protein